MKNKYIFPYKYGRDIQFNSWLEDYLISLRTKHNKIQTSKIRDAIYMIENNCGYHISCFSQDSNCDYTQNVIDMQKYISQFCDEVAIEHLIGWKDTFFDSQDGGEEFGRIDNIIYLCHIPTSHPEDICLQLDKDKITNRASPLCEQSQIKYIKDGSWLNGGYSLIIIIPTIGY